MTDKTSSGLAGRIADGAKTLISDRRTWWSLLAIAVIGVIAFSFFWPDAAEGNLLRQHDMQQGIAIGQEAKAFHEATGETSRWTNSLFGGMPTFQIAPDYPSNHLFKWIDTLMGLGLPSPANLIAMMMIGFFILGLAMKMRWWVALIGAIGYGFSSYFVIIIGAGHIWKFVTLAYVPPTFAGIVLCYRGHYLAGSALAALFATMQIASNHVQMSYYFMFVAIGFVIAYFVRDLKAHRLRNWSIATGALAIAAALAVTANLPGLYNTYEYSKETMRGGHSELTRTSTDASQTTDGLDRDYITQYSYAPSETFSLLIPNIKGGASAKPEKGSMKIMSLDAMPEASEMAGRGEIDAMEMQYLQYMSQYFGDPEGTNGPVYVGALIFALFMLGVIIVRGPVKWTLVVLTVLSVFLAWGRHMMWLTDWFIDYIPMYSKFRTVESILVIAGFTMPVLAMMALQKVLTAKPEQTEDLRKPLLWSFGITLAFCLVGIIWPEAYGSLISDNDRMIDSMITGELTSQGYDYATTRAFSLESPRIYAAVTGLRSQLVEADAMRSFLIVAAGFGVILLFMRRKLPVGIAAAAIALIVAADMFTVNKRYVDHESFVPRRLTTGAPIAMTDADRIILADTTSHYRVLNLPQFNSSDPSYYHKTIGGYHAAKLTRYQDMIERHLSHFLNGSDTDADWRIINMLNARYIVDFDGNPLRNPDAYGNAWFVDAVDYVADADNEMAALDIIDTRHKAVADKRFATLLGNSLPAAPTDTIALTSYAPNRLTYHSQSQRGGVGVFSEIYFPWGWHATIDGAPVEIARVDYLLRAIKVPAGSHTIEMWFDPQSLHTTDTMARIAVIMIYLALAASLVITLARRKQPEIG